MREELPQQHFRDFAKALRTGRVLLMDGAMGTELQRAGSADGECYEALNLTQAEVIRDIHRAYAAAGATVLLTNTFQANPAALGRHHQQDNLAPIIEAGVALARAALPSAGWLLADIGPFAAPDRKQIIPILDAFAGVDAILLETFSDPAEAARFVRANQSAPGPQKPMLVSFTFDGATRKTFRGVSPEKCAEAAAAMDAAALGVNCGRDMDIAACAEMLRRYRTVTDLQLFARINAGSRTGKYGRSAEEMAVLLSHLLEAGAVMVGGCCGTTPKHIEAFKLVVDEWNAQRSRDR